MTGDQAKILIVDDEKGMRDLLSFMLCTEGYHIMEVTSSQEAIECLANETFDVVIADIRMPGMDGLDLLRRIRSRDDDVIVIVMTAYASLETAIKAMKFGAYDYLIKPFNDVEKVMNIVARAVERSQLARRNAQLLKDLQAANRRLKELFTESQERTAQLEAAYNELKERNLFKSQLVSNISHQLRTPLALVKGYVMLMVDRFLGGVTEEQAIALEMVNERTDNLIQVVDDLLFMQDIESGNAYLCLEAVSVPRLVRRVCHRIRPRIQRKIVTLQVTIQEDKKTPIIQGDPLRLEQAFTHLLDNAIKFSAPGSCVSVEVGVRDQHLYLSVHNQGHNILPENLVRPVDSLYQATLSPRQQAGDLGMGLLLVKHIAEMHGGDVIITSDPDAGTTVCLTLPLEDKGRLLHQSMALTSDSANQFRMALQSFSTPQPAWQTI